MPASSPPAGRWSSPASRIRLEGPDALRFLHGQSSQHLEGATPGQCLATCLISPTARVRALALVLVDADGAELVVVAGDGAAVHQALDRVLFPADRVVLAPPQACTLVRLVGVAAGPMAEVAASTGRWLEAPVPLGAGPAGTPVLLLEAGQTLPAAVAALPELTAEQAERLRMRQGFPAVPSEINDSTNPFELGLAAWVSLSKGCYVGQETLAKLATYDGVKQQLRHWQWRAGAGAEAGAGAGAGAASGAVAGVTREALAAGTALVGAEGERAGVITSLLINAEGAEGLALVRRQALGASQLWVGGGDGMALSIDPPEAFAAPPVGAGGAAPQA